MARGRTNLQASKTFLSFLSQKITLLDLKKKSRYISKFSSGFKTDNYGVQGDKTDKKCRRRIRSLLQLLRRHDGRSHLHLFWIRITDVDTYENKMVMYFWIVQCMKSVEGFLWWWIVEMTEIRHWKSGLSLFMFKDADVANSIFDACVLPNWHVCLLLNACFGFLWMKVYL